VQAAALRPTGFGSGAATVAVCKAPRRKRALGRGGRKNRGVLARSSSALQLQPVDVHSSSLD
jgi:hypothetical protein